MPGYAVACACSFATGCCFLSSSTIKQITGVSCLRSAVVAAIKCFYLWERSFYHLQVGRLDADRLNSLSSSINSEAGYGLTAVGKLLHVVHLFHLLMSQIANL
ncbi:hypothetical protein DITRI_Ditri13aG0080200 [Diplodiscus trichospermus]